MGWFTTTDEAIEALGSSKDSKRLWGLTMLRNRATDKGRKRRIGQHDVAVKQVVRLLNDATPDIQAGAADTILTLVDSDSSNQERIGAEPGAVEGLAAMLGSSDRRVQLFAAKALRHLAANHPGNKARVGAVDGATEGLILLLYGFDTEVQQGAGLALVVLTDKHPANSVAIASRPDALPALARLLGCNVHPALQVVAAGVLGNLCIGSPAHGQQLVERFPDALQQLEELAMAAARPDKGQHAALALLSIAASCAAGRQLLLKQPGVLAPLALTCHDYTADRNSWKVEDAREVVELLLVVVKAEASMRKVVGGHRQLLAALEELQARSSDEATGAAAGAVLVLVGTKAAAQGRSWGDSPSHVQVS
jgi:hypothetical protein